MSGYSSYIASYKNGDGNIMISVVVYDGADPTHFESEENTPKYIMQTE